MVLEKVSQNARDRVDAVKTQVTDLIGIGKAVIGDVMRVAKGQQASLPGQVGLVGKQHGIVDEPIAIVVALSDSVSRHAQRQIEITRRWA